MFNRTQLGRTDRYEQLIHSILEKNREVVDLEKQRDNAKAELEDITAQSTKLMEYLSAKPDGKLTSVHQGQRSQIQESVNVALFSKQLVGLSQDKLTQKEALLEAKVDELEKLLDKWIKIADTRPTDTGGVIDVDAYRLWKKYRSRRT